MKTISIDDKKIEISDESYEAFKKQFIKPDKAILWRPEHGEAYFAVSSDGEVYKYRFCSEAIDEHHYKMGGIFRTEEEAQEALETGWIAKRKAEVKILRFIAENDLEFEFDWSKRQVKHFIYYNHSDQAFKPNTWIYCQESTNFHFKSKEDAQKLIDAMTPELKILFGVIN